MVNCGRRVYHEVRNASGIQWIPLDGISQKADADNLIGIDGDSPCEFSLSGIRKREQR